MAKKGKCIESSTKEGPQLQKLVIDKVVPNIEVMLPVDMIPKVPRRKEELVSLDFLRDRLVPQKTQEEIEVEKRQEERKLEKEIRKEKDNIIWNVAANRARKQRFNKNYHPIKDFMTKDLIEIRKKNKKLLNKVKKRQGDPDLYAQYVEQRNIYNAMVRQAKKAKLDEKGLDPSKIKIIDQALRAGAGKVDLPTYAQTIKKFVMPKRRRHGSNLSDEGPECSCEHHRRLHKWELNRMAMSCQELSTQMENSELEEESPVLISTGVSMHGENGLSFSQHMEKILEEKSLVEFVPRFQAVTEKSTHDAMSTKLTLEDEASTECIEKSTEPTTTADSTELGTQSSERAEPRTQEEDGTETTIYNELENIRASLHSIGLLMRETAKRCGGNNKE
eukprot:TRINITY_DN1148_c0_g1_i5.p1 TRINITY_DN1148_c0_g1~~TRINITY_DN1148_c0_g1_i5.p1  ORF type:complete len:390 (+),score=69.61 TRINITY_DN1148_c0_g1_i5:59-1228(+)